MGLGVSRTWVQPLALFTLSNSPPASSGLFSHLLNGHDHHSLSGSPKDSTRSLWYKHRSVALGTGASCHLDHRSLKPQAPKAFPEPLGSDDLTHHWCLEATQETQEGCGSLLPFSRRKVGKQWRTSTWGAGFQIRPQSESALCCLFRLPHCGQAERGPEIQEPLGKTSPLYSYLPTGSKAVLLNPLQPPKLSWAIVTTETRTGIHLPTKVKRQVAWQDGVIGNPPDLGSKPTSAI